MFNIPPTTRPDLCGNMQGIYDLTMNTLKNTNMKHYNFTRKNYIYIYTTPFLKSPTRDESARVNDKVKKNVYPGRSFKFIYMYITDQPL